MSAAPAPARSKDHNNRTIPLREEQLTPRHRLLVEYILHGLPHPSLCHRTMVVDHYDQVTGEPILRHPHVGEPLDPIAAGEILRIRRRNVRALQRQPAFERLLAAETSAFRNGAKARATRRMVALIDEPGAGKAADRKVQLAASQAVLGEGDGNRSGVTINMPGSTQITAGVVIRLPDTAKRTPLEHAHTIEHDDAT